MGDSSLSSAAITPRDDRFYTPRANSINSARTGCRGKQLSWVGRAGWEDSRERNRSECTRVGVSRGVIGD